MGRKEDVQSPQRKGREKSNPKPSYIRFVTAPPDYPVQWIQVYSLSLNGFIK